MYHWGSAFADQGFSWLPHGIRGLMRRVWGISVSQMLIMEALVSFREADDAAGQEFWVWASIDTLVERTGLNYDTVARLLRDLLKQGAVRQVRAPSRGRARVYDLYNFLTSLNETRAESDVAKEKLQVIRGGV
jgi:predicted transcriptional regulator